MIKRIIPPIGQGCCVEQRIFSEGKTLRVLYDCGSFQKKLLHHYIDSINTDIETVLVVSHLHRDHINGIPYLIDHFKENGQKIKELYMPDYYPNMLNLFVASIIADSMEDDLEVDSRLLDFTLDPVGFGGFGTIVYVVPDGTAGSGAGRSSVISDTDLRPLIHNWNMKFWVDPDIYRLLDAEDLELIKKYRPEDFKDKDKKDDITSVYKKIVKDNESKFNKTSMLMALLLPIECKKLIYIYPNDSDINKAVNLASAGFICTGDYPFNDKGKIKTIHSHYSQEQYLIKEIMAPHHGGDDYSEYMPFDFVEKAYAQYGEKNKYHHPGDGTILNMRNWGIEFVGIHGFDI
jgi:hypothetical protein